MLKMFKDWPAWRAQNERAHRNAKAGPCCCDPRQIYAARRTADGSKRHVRD
jgi:hypothetical protein